MAWPANKSKTAAPGAGSVGVGDGRSVFITLWSVDTEHVSNASLIKIKSRLQNCEVSKNLEKILLAIKILKS